MHRKEVNRQCTLSRLKEIRCSWNFGKYSSHRFQYWERWVSGWFQVWRFSARIRRTMDLGVRYCHRRNAESHQHRILSPRVRWQVVHHSPKNKLRYTGVYRGFSFSCSRVQWGTSLPLPSCYATLFVGSTKRTAVTMTERRLMLWYEVCWSFRF